MANTDATIDDVTRCVLASYDDDACHQMASYFCCECADYLCDECYVSHKRHKQTIRHNPRCLRDISSAEIKLYILRKVPLCTKHPGYGINLYCECCEEAACGRCQMLWHEGHKCLDMIEADANFCLSISRVEVKTKKFLWDCNCAVERLQDSFESFKKFMNAAREEVEEAQTKVAKFVNVTVSYVVGELNAVEFKMANEIKQALDNTCAVRANLKQLLDVCHAALESSAPQRIYAWKYLKQFLDDVDMHSIENMIVNMKLYAEQVWFESFNCGVCFFDDVKVKQIYACTFQQEIHLAESSQPVIALCGSGNAFSYAFENSDNFFFNCDQNGHSNTIISLRCVSSAAVLPDKRVVIAAEKQSVIFLSEGGEIILKQCGNECGLGIPWSVCVSESGTLFLADLEKGILMFDSRNLQWKPLVLFPELKDPWRVVCVKETILWIAYGNDIYIYEICNQGNGQFGKLIRLISLNDIPGEVDFISFVSNNCGNVLLLGDKSVHVFSENGDFLSTVVKNLRSPSRIIIDEIENKLFVCHSENKMNIYSLSLVEMISQSIKLQSHKCVENNRQTVYENF